MPTAGSNERPWPGWWRSALGRRYAAVFALLVQKRIRSGWLLLPLALLAWVLIHESGVHATVAGVLQVAGQGAFDAGRSKADGRLTLTPQSPIPGLSPLLASLPKAGEGFVVTF